MAIAKERNSGRAERQRERAGPVDADRPHCRRLIADAEDERHSLQVGAKAAAVARSAARLDDLRQCGSRQAGRGRKLVRPCAGQRVLQLHAAGLVGVDDEIGGRIESPADEILDAIEAMDAVREGRVAPKRVEPFGEREVRQGEIAGLLHDRGRSAMRRHEFVEVGRAVHVEPQLDGGGEATVAVDRDEPVHLAGETDRVGPTARDQRRQSPARQRHPALGITRRRTVGRIGFADGLRHRDAAVDLGENGLDRGGADVDADGAHQITP